jgi:hypothetical protein
MSWPGHRYLSKVNCRGILVYQNIYLNQSASSGHIDKTKQPVEVNGQSTKTRQAGLFNVPALTTNIFAAATNNTIIHNKTGSMHF